MSKIYRIVVLAGILLSLLSCAHPQLSEDRKPESALDRAIVAAQILPSDSLETKVQKALKLINQDRYYYPKGPPPKFEAPFDQPYHLDSLRTPEQILEQKVGGFCGTAALVFSALLTKSGVKAEDVRVVAAVNSPDLEVICPKAQQPRIEHPMTGASGHVFVALKFPGGEWRLINTIDGTNYESVTWMSPEALERLMREGPVQIPFSVYRRFPLEFRSLPMVVFKSWRGDQVPLHTFDQRLDLIASGEMAGANKAGAIDPAKTCRYGATEMKRLKKN